MGLRLHLVVKNDISHKMSIWITDSLIFLVFPQPRGSWGQHFVIRKPAEGSEGRWVALRGRRGTAVPPETPHCSPCDCGAAVATVHGAYTRRAACRALQKLGVLTPKHKFVIRKREMALWALLGRLRERRCSAGPPGTLHGSPYDQRGTVVTVRGTYACRAARSALQESAFPTS